MSRFFFKVAGVDNELIERMPQDDKVWVTQIGIMLFLVYIFVFIVIFFSLHYLFVSREVSILHNGFIFSESISSTKLLLVVLISFIITTMIVMLDRTIIISDWYYSDSYEELSFFQKLGSFFKKIIRVIPRLLISVALAYAISIFLLLRIYDGQISKVLKDRYIQSNSVIEKKIENYKKSLDLEIKKVREEIKNKRAELLINSPTVLWSQDSYLNQLLNTLNSKNKLVKQIKETINNAENKKILNEYKKLKKEVLRYKNLMKMEENGISRFNNQQASGIKGRGKRYRKYQELYKLALQNLKDQQKEYKKIEILFKKQNKLEQEIKELESKITNRREVISRGYKENLKERKRVLRNEIKELQQRYQDLITTKEAKIKEFISNVLKSVDYKRFDDGIMVRYVVMQELFRDKEYGKSREYFAYLLKALLVFIELLPIIIKLFFSPPTVYSIAIQQRLKCMNRILKDGKDECIDKFYKSMNLIKEGEQK